MGRGMISSQFKSRLTISFLAILTLIVCIYFSHNPFFKTVFILLATTVTCLSLNEYYQLAKQKDFQPLVAGGLGASIAYIGALTLSFHYPSLSSLPTLILLASLLLFFLPFFFQRGSLLGNLAVTVFGLVYITLPLACCLQINYFFPVSQKGSIWLTYALIVSKITDTGAYFCGKGFGKTKLAPLISPKKTIEGAIGGMLAALLASVCFSLFATGAKASFSLPIGQSIFFGILFSVLAQVGDLAESLLKRDAGLKNSGHHLHGMGGWLDIVDSLIFTLPLMYLLLKMHVIQ